MFEFKKIVFLDIDGCLTSVDGGSSYLLLNPDKYGPQKDKIELIRRICRETDSNVVMSTNWRRYEGGMCFNYNGLEFMNPMPYVVDELGELYVGDLPHDRHINKSEALTLWFEDNGLKYYDIEFAIIDDDYRESFDSNPNFCNHYFHCDFQYGITSSMADDIIKFLGRKTVA